MTAAIQEEGRGFVCLGKFSRADSRKFDAETDALTKFVKEIQFNTQKRLENQVFL